MMIYFTVAFLANNNEKEKIYNTCFWVNLEL